MKMSHHGLRSSSNGSGRSSTTSTSTSEPHPFDSLDVVDKVEFIATQWLRSVSFRFPLPPYMTRFIEPAVLNHVELVIVAEFKDMLEEVRLISAEHPGRASAALDGIVGDAYSDDGSSLLTSIRNHWSQCGTWRGCPGNVAQTVEAVRSERDRSLMIIHCKTLRPKKRVPPKIPGAPPFL